MDKIAIISDIHGNLEALKAVLDDIKEKNIQTIFCLGDIIAKGTHQQECLDLIRENCEVVIKGNCDEFFTSDIDLSEATDEETKLILWNKRKINPESTKYLQQLPYCHEIYMSGRLIRFVHAHPEKIDRFVGNIDKLENFYSLFLPSSNTISQNKADILVYGHIHTPFVQKIYNRTIINTGSVGESVDVFRNKEKDGDTRNTTVANYLILKGKLHSKDFKDPLSYEIVNVSYDFNKELSSNKDNIDIDGYTTELTTGKYRNMSIIYKSFEARGIDKDKV